jgi:hypothetical protein
MSNRTAKEEGTMAKRSDILREDVVIKVKRGLPTGWATRFRR